MKCIIEQRIDTSFLSFFTFLFSFWVICMIINHRITLSKSLSANDILRVWSWRVLFRWTFFWMKNQILNDFCLSIIDVPCWSELVVSSRNNVINNQMAWDGLESFPFDSDRCFSHEADRKKNLKRLYLKTDWNSE